MKRFIAFTLFAAPFCGAPVSAQQEHKLAEMPIYQTPVPYMGVRNWHLTQNLGATGVRAWIEGNRGHSHDSREILIKSIEPGSPADGIPCQFMEGHACPQAI